MWGEYLHPRRILAKLPGHPDPTDYEVVEDSGEWVKLKSKWGESWIEWKQVYIIKEL